MKKPKTREPLKVLQPGDHSEYFESLLRLKAENPQAYAVLSPALKIAVSRYVELREGKKRGGTRDATYTNYIDLQTNEIKI